MEARGIFVECKERWPSEAARIYLQICRKLGLVPISYYLRHINDEQIVLRHHSIDELAAKAIAAPLVVSIATGVPVVVLTLQSLSDPYCQSTCLCVCLFVRNFGAKYLGN